MTDECDWTSAHDIRLQFSHHHHRSSFVWRTQFCYITASSLRWRHTTSRHRSAHQSEGFLRVTSSLLRLTSPSAVDLCSSIQAVWILPLMNRVWTLSIVRVESPVKTWTFVDQDRIELRSKFVIRREYWGCPTTSSIALESVVRRLSVAVVSSVSYQVLPRHQRRLHRVRQHRIRSTAVEVVSVLIIWLDFDRSSVCLYPSYYFVN